MDGCSARPDGDDVCPYCGAAECRCPWAREWPDEPTPAEPPRTMRELVEGERPADLEVTG